jgi:single-strand DNA-binding protein
MANFNFNKVFLGGRLTSDPEIKQTPNGKMVCQFSVAVNRKGKDQPTDFINCVAWEKSAELLSKFFRKGSSICVVGELQVRQWKDKDGGNRYATEVRVSEINFVDSKSDNDSPAQNYMPDVYKNEPKPSFVDMDDDSDIPF